MRLGYRAKVSSKGQVVIPQKLREKLGLQAGDEVEFQVLDDKTVLAQKVEPTRFEVMAKRMRADLRARGVTAADVRRASREVRQEVYEEHYAQPARKKAVS
jgi:AbrB family looped-hinge helix DNA binding protein